MKLHLNDRQKLDLAILLLTAIREDCPNLPKVNKDFLGYPLSTRMLEQLSNKSGEWQLNLAKRLLAELGQSSGKAVEAGSPFGPRESPGGIGSTYHRGQDIPAPSGTPLYAVGMKGEQVQVTCFWNDAGGNQAKLSAPSYSKLGITLGAAHMVEPCKSGVYQAGQVFGHVGSTGHSTGAHLHFAQKLNGEFVMPQRWGAQAMLTGQTVEGLK